MKKTLTLRIEGPEGDALTKALLAQFEAYRTVQPNVHIERASGASPRVTMSYGTRQGHADTLPASEPKRASYLVARAIRELLDLEHGVVHRIGFLFGEKQAQAGYDELAAYFAKSHATLALEKVDLHAGTDWKDVDETLEGLIVTSPKSDMSPKELRRIDKFLMHGRPVAIFANNVLMHSHDTLMHATGDGGLLPLLNGYGIEFKSPLVVDKHQFWQPSLKHILLDPYPPAFVAPSKPSPTFDTNFPGFVEVPQLVLAFPTEVSVNTARATRFGATVNRVAWTTKEIITVQGTGFSLHPAREKMGNGATGQAEEKREATLAVTITGPIGSAFDKPGGGVNDVPASVAGGKGRLLVVSSGGFLANPFREAGESPFGFAAPGIDAMTGADAELMRYAEIYEPLRPSTMLVAKQACDWLLRTDEFVDP